MKIIIPVNEKNLQTQICNSFGRAPFFFVFDSETKDSLFLDNHAVNSTGGAGVKAAQTMIDYKANVVITFSCGENAANVLKAADIQLYKAMNASLEKNIEAYFTSNLSLLDEIHAGLHLHGN